MEEKTRHRTHLKQKNKPFKGRSKSKKDKGRSVPTLAHVAEWSAETKQSRKNTAAQKRKANQEASLRKIRGIGENLRISLKLLG